MVTVLECLMALSLFLLFGYDFNLTHIFQTFLSFLLLLQSPFSHRLHDQSQLYDSHDLCLFPFFYVFLLSHDRWIKGSPHCIMIFSDTGHFIYM